MFSLKKVLIVVVSITILSGAFLCGVGLGYYMAYAELEEAFTSALRDEIWKRVEARSAAREAEAARVAAEARAAVHEAEAARVAAEARAATQLP